MLIIDARSGKEVELNVPIYYNDDEYFVLLKIKTGIFSAVATLERRYFSYVSYTFIEDVVTVPLAIRYFHPNFFGKRVVFTPS